MNRLMTVGVLLMGLVMAGGCTCMETRERMIGDAKALDQKFMKAFNTQDLDNVMACYWSSPDLVVFTPDGQTCRGWDATKDMYDRMLPTMRGSKLELTETHYDVAGDHVVAWGLWRMTAPGQAGEMRGVFTEVAAKRHGAWVYVVDHPAATLPPMEAPAGATTKPKK